jgi:nitrogen-specific signal transduction histidine kinase
MLAHELLNNLSVIVGSCDLLQPQQNLEDQSAKHVTRIRDTAKSMAERLNHRQCHLAVLARSAELQQQKCVS